MKILLRPLSALTMLTLGLTLPLLAGCGAEPQPPAQPPALVDDESNPWVTPVPVPAERPAKPSPVAAAKSADCAWEAFAPGVRIDRACRKVEVEGVVPIDAHDPQAPAVYLEAIACTPDTREHEALVVVKGAPSRLHAALLMLGLEPGRPGRVGWDGTTMRSDAPAGPPVTIRIAWRNADGAWIEASAADWVINARTGKHLSEESPQDRWVFSGSRFITRKDPQSGETRELYDADHAGTMIGLHTFGSETIAWSRPLNPDAAAEAPEWIADAKRVPKAGTPVVIIVAPASDAPRDPPQPVER